MLIEIRSVLTWGGAGMTESTVVKETFWGEEIWGVIATWAYLLVNIR